MAEEPDLYVCLDDHAFDYEGAPVVIHAGSVVRAGHPIMKGREQKWAPLTIILSHDDHPPAYAKVVVMGAGELGPGYRRWSPILTKADAPASAEMRW